LVVTDGGGEVVVAHGLAVVGEVKTRYSQYAPHDVVALESHLHHGVSVEFPDDLFEIGVGEVVSLGCRF
jgi:hypothetical protein